MFKYSDEYIAKLIADIHSGKITAHDLPESLYYAIADHLKQGLYKGFGADMSTVSEGDAELLAELRDNVYMFSAAKTYQQVREMVEATTDEKGNVILFNDFKKEAKEIFIRYNGDPEDFDNGGYLKTEFDTAIGQAQSAVKWNSIEEQKDVLPYLQYSTIGDACDICEPLNGLTAPVDDPVWDDIMPLNHFNCLCLVEQLDEDEGKENLTPDVDEVVGPVLERMDNVFKMNPGKDGYVFSPDHPYFSVPKEDKEFAQNNFDLPIPKDDE